MSEFAKHGFAGASIRGITKQLGLQASSFYAHFESKQAAYDELFQEGGPAVMARYAGAIPPEITPSEALAQVAKGVMQEWAKPRARALASIALRENFALEGDKRGQLLQGIESALAALQTQFSHWQSARAIRTDVDSHMLAFEFAAPLVMIRFLYYNQAASPEQMDQGQSLVSAHVRSFLTLLNLSAGSRIRLP